MSATISITLNGTPRQTAAPDLATLVRELNLEPERVVAEHNGTIVPAEDFARVALAEGDVLELLRFVGGG